MKTTIICLVALIVLAYLFGSVNFAIIITKWFAKKDIRNYGSGNAGMTNVLRTLGKLPAVLTFVGDFLKGFLAVLITRIVFVQLLGQTDNFVVEYAVGFSALMGHIFPVFYGFKGGKGITVSAGAMLLLSPISLACCIGVFLIGLLATRIVSVGSIGASITFPVSVLIIKLCTGEPYVFLETFMALLMAVLVIYMHRANIGRLIRGEENRFGKKKEEKETAAKN